MCAQACLVFEWEQAGLLREHGNIGRRLLVANIYLHSTTKVPVCFMLCFYFSHLAGQGGHCCVVNGSWHVHVQHQEPHRRQHTIPPSAEGPMRQWRHGELRDLIAS
jgi:hypothetical protein